MARRLDPNGRNLYARLFRYLSEGDDRLDQDMIRAVEAPPAESGRETTPDPAPPEPVAEKALQRRSRAARIFYGVTATLLTALISLLRSERHGETCEKGETFGGFRLE